MSITSFYFFIFLFVIAILYYLIPTRNRWWVILIANVVFFVTSTGIGAIGYAISAIVVSYAGALLIQKTDKEPLKKLIVILVIVILVGELAFLKYRRLLVTTCYLFGIDISGDWVQVIAPIGMSYYTLSILGYVLDVYWEKYSAETNIFKLITYTLYFPTLTSGPIMRYDDMSLKIFEAREFQPQKVLHGIELLIWGLIKKLVLADRLSLWVSTIYGSYSSYNGWIILLGIMLFSIQLYADFSGCMDIIMGVSEIFGIDLPVNFRTPFASESVAEFWRRWHITLGVWFKDYLLYPILKSDALQALQKLLKKRFSKKISKKLPTYIGLLAIWITIGIWHGGSYKFIFASGIIPGFFLILEDLLEPVVERINKKLSINTESKIYHFLCRLRTMICILSVWVFIKADSFRQGIDIIKHLVTNRQALPESVSSLITDKVVFTSTSEHFINMFGISVSLDHLVDIFVIAVTFIMVIVVGIMHERGVKIREKISARPVCVQWIILIVALFWVMTFGIYGPAFNASDFIYKFF